MNLQFPEITVQGGKINAKDYEERGTRLLVFCAFLITIIVTLSAVVASYGIFLIVLLLYPLFASYLHKKAMARIHGSGVLVSEYQFPSIYKCMMTFKERFDITKEVFIYIVEDNVVNALVVKYGRKNVILLTDDLIHGCLASNNPQALSFVIGHEFGHIALNHSGVFRSWIAQHLKKLNRLDEYSADAIATALVHDKAIAFTGLLLLTVGYALLPYVNSERIVTQAQEVALNKYSKRAERSITHPLLLNRLHRMLL